MAGLAGILGNPILEQLLLYNVVGQLIGAALGPYMIALTNEVNQASPLVPLSPADMADAVVRSIVTETDAAREAKFSGISESRFHTLALLAGNAPDPTSLAVALRRGIIDEATFTTGIGQGRLRNEWALVVKALAVQQPAPGAVLAAYLEGQIGEAEARERYAKLGGDPDYFDILFHTEGQAPTPVQALEMANRGIIPWSGTGPDATTFEQAFLEGPWRNKWLEPFRAIGAYLPPPRTVTAMHREGSLTDAEATSLLEKQGLTPELAAAYLASSSKQKTTKTKELAQGIVVKLYHDRLIPHAEAVTFLERLNYTEAEAGFILAVEDLALMEKFMASAIGRIHTYYVGHKITAAAALSALADLKVEAGQASELVALWEHEHAANIKHVTAGEISAAFEHKIIDQPTAMAMLEEEGWPPYDAWLHLSIKNKAALPDEPARPSLTPAAGF